MTYQPDIDYPLKAGNRDLHYKISPKHRVATPSENLSIWQVDYQSEVQCFIDSIDSSYAVGHRAWGFISSPPFSKLGIGKFSNEITELFMAKFVDGDKNDKWHGYPCYYKRVADTPPKSVLTRWVKEEIITKKQMSKISQRQICKL